MHNNNHEQRLVWKEQAAEHYVNNLVFRDPSQNQTDLAIDEGNVDSTPWPTLLRMLHLLQT